MDKSYALFLLVMLYNSFVYTQHDLIRGNTPELESPAHASIEYVKKKYEHKTNDIDYLWYPAKKPKQLWIIFGGAIPDRYSRWSWFWNSEEQWEDISYLFLRDDNRTWYFGTPEQPLTETYCSIIKDVMLASHLSEKDIFMIGNSMGGYAALRFGLLLGVRGILAIRPQTEWMSAVQFHGVKKLSGLWIDIEDLILQSNHIPFIYLHFGIFGPDKQAIKKCLKALSVKPSTIIIEKTNELSHSHGFPNKNQTLSIINYMNNIPQPFLEK